MLHFSALKTCLQGSVFKEAHSTTGLGKWLPIILADNIKFAAFFVMKHHKETRKRTK